MKTRADAPPDFFTAEAKGLRWLGEVTPAGGPHVPRVLDVERHSITIERVDTVPWSHAHDETFGRALATLHRAGASTFGAPWAGYIGPLPLDNTPSDDWEEFYATRRVEPYLDALDERDRRTIRGVLDRIDQLSGPPEPPSRIHGDLWRGNVLASADGRTWVIDPAAHGGHRETDLAMMRLFGGFGPRAYDAYDEAFPLGDGWRDRIALHQLHPLLVHVSLFGDAYREQAIAAARWYE